MINAGNNDAPIATGIHRNLLQERISFGRSAADSVTAECRKLKKDRVFIVTSHSYAGDHPLLASLRDALGPRYVGVYSDVKAHVPRGCVIEGARAARRADADLLLAVGGGSTVDAAKAILLCLWHNIVQDNQIDAFVGKRISDSSRMDFNRNDHIRMIAIPTMFSGAEYTCFTGITDPARSIKEMVGDPMLIPISVILDPSATLTTPWRLLAATGMKALEHAVERLCSPESNPFADATAATALKLLYNALPHIGGSEDGLKHRQDCQIAAWLSMMGENSGVSVGASHAIGHVLGGYGVPHGYTTAICLPAVLNWNSQSNSERQQMVRAIIDASENSLADTTLALANQLGLPTRLSEVGIKRDQLEDIAKKSLLDPFVQTNPRPFRSGAEMCELLELAW